MLKKLCPRCNKPIEYTQKYCESCGHKAKQDKRESNRLYDKTQRNTKSTDFYHSKEWESARLQAKVRDNGFCRLCILNGKVNYMDTVHHIIELKFSWEDRVNLLNLISLCNACHNKVHAAYDRSEEDKKQMQELLQSILKGFKMN